MSSEGGSSLFEVLLLLLPSTSWLLALEDIAPVIGFLVIVTIVVVMLIVFVKWYRYWVKKGFEEYEQKHG